MPLKSKSQYFDHKNCTTKILLNKKTEKDKFYMPAKYVESS